MSQRENEMTKLGSTTSKEHSLARGQSIIRHYASAPDERFKVANQLCTRELGQVSRSTVVKLGYRHENQCSDYSVGCLCGRARALTSQHPRGAFAELALTVAQHGGCWCDAARSISRRPRLSSQLFSMPGCALFFVVSSSFVLFHFAPRDPSLCHDFFLPSFLVIAASFASKLWTWIFVFKLKIELKQWLVRIYLLVFVYNDCTKDLLEKCIEEL